MTTVIENNFLFALYTVAESTIPHVNSNSGGSTIPLFQSINQSINWFICMAAQKLG